MGPYDYVLFLRSTGRLRDARLDLQRFRLATSGNRLPKAISPKLKTASLSIAKGRSGRTFQHGQHAGTILAQATFGLPALAAVGSSLSLMPDLSETHECNYRSLRLLHDP